ncbi:MAG TPA: cytochrome c oxidase subunit II [Bacteroidota bacterium]|nr:cytochrome c oxidase subunit II [Bacteroidota bacterium]
MTSLLSIFPLFPVEASQQARQIDELYVALVIIASIFTAIIFVCLAYFAVRYRKGSRANREMRHPENLKLEIAWTVIPLIISAGIYVWSAKLFFDLHVAPKNAIEIYVVAKQWMWKIEHPEGNREINALHIPVGIPVKLVMTSQDVIHSFYVPAFRVKQDVLPDRYTTEWFLPTKVGTYHLFCAEYCGTGHASMIGTVYVMDQADYQQWLAGKSGEVPLATSGEDLFQHFACSTCHQLNDMGRGPSLYGLFGSMVRLQNGQRVIADQSYIRNSIYDPGDQVVAGYRAIMPTFRKQIDPDQMAALIEYIKTLGAPAKPAKGTKQ